MSTVQTTNINVNIINFQEAYTSLGMGTIPAGTSVANGVAAIEKALIANLMSKWPASYPASEPNQVDDGIMEPWSSNVAGTAPVCLVNQITTDFNSWQLPYNSDLLMQMGNEITTEIAANGGQTGYFYGQTSLAGSEKIYWGVAYATAVVIGPPSNATGVIYAFSAVLGLN
ncbi:hypothetical protein [Undibacterium sp. RuTC16W]|uniref:hypothetical protein n=1 Tax=Undibacterium sp. RuTC16W TaxID=3413048 RepID=UPI003BF35A43